jgi:hypothetical protein
LTAIAIQLTGCGPGVRVKGIAEPGSTGSATSTPAQPVLLAGAPPSSVVVGTDYTFQPTVLQGAGPITFTIEGKPAWATFNPATGALSGTPNSAQIGTYAGIAISATDGTTSASLAAFTITVMPSAGAATLIWSAPTKTL